MDVNRPSFENLTIKNKIHSNKMRCICQLCSCGEHKCQQFETATLLTTTKTTTGSEDANVSQKNMPTQLPTSTNLNNIESSTSQANTNLQSIGKLEKWNTTPEHIQQVTNNIEKQQQLIQQTQQIQSQHQQSSKETHPPIVTKSVSKHHLPPVTRKTVLAPVPQARSSITYKPHLRTSDYSTSVNHKAIYQSVLNPMASFSTNDQEWLVAKQQRVPRPKDHRDMLAIDPAISQTPAHYITTVRPVTDVDIKRNEFIERKIAQEQYRQQLEHQIMQQKPVRPFLPRNTLRFDGEIEFKTETKQNYKPFRFVKNLNDDLMDKCCANGNENVRKNSMEKDPTPQQQIANNINEQKVVCCQTKANRPQSSLTGAKFKDHLQTQPDTSSQRRHLDQINQFENEQRQQNIYYQQNYPHHHHPNETQQRPIEIDENNNIIIEQRPTNDPPQYKNSVPAETFCCDHCRHHYLNGINVPIGSATNQNQIELNPLVGVRASQTNKLANGHESVQQRPTRRKIKEHQQVQSPTIVRSKSTHFQQQSNRDATIPRMIVPGKQRPHKNQSHLKFEGQNYFQTTNNQMYRDHSMQNLNSYPDDEYRQLNRGTFAEQQMAPTTNNKKSITGNIRGRVKNKYRDLFASSEDIFGTQDQDKQQQNFTQNGRLSVKHKSAVNLPQMHDEYDGRYYGDDHRTNQQNEESYEASYQNDYPNEEEYEYSGNYAHNNYIQSNEENEIDEESPYDEEATPTDNGGQVVETKKQKKLIFIPKDQSPPAHLLNSSVFEGRRNANTTNSNYGSMLKCPALDLSSDSNNKYEYRYTIGNHKYFTKKSSIN